MTIDSSGQAGERLRARLYNKAGKWNRPEPVGRDNKSMNIANVWRKDIISLAER